jgi:hypothetical protein
VKFSTADFLLLLFFFFFFFLLLGNDLTKINSTEGVIAVKRGVLSLETQML